MLATHLGLFRRDRPKGGVEIEIRPFHRADFAWTLEQVRRQGQRGLGRCMPTVAVDRPRQLPELDRVDDRRVMAHLGCREIQLDALHAAGCEEIFSEKRSGTSTAGRDELKNALSFVRKSDTLVVTRLDRLARSAADLHSTGKHLTEKGVAFQCLQQSSIDTTTSTGKLLLGVLASIAEFEADIRREHQREGIEKAKAAGVYKGRKPAIDASAVRALRDQGFRGHRDCEHARYSAGECVSCAVWRLSRKATAVFAYCAGDGTLRIYRNL